MTRRLIFSAMAAGALWFAACQANERSQPAEEQANEAQAQPKARRAVAKLEAKSGSDLSGEAYFVQKDDGTVDFGVNIHGVSPGEHAVHIHEFGDCSAEDASSAGGHWNPTNEQHGKWGSEHFHLGDIGNIQVDEEGSGTLTMTTDRWTLADTGDRSVLGKSIIVHAGADDFESQPAGNAGARIGCGVITLEPQT